MFILLLSLSLVSQITYSDDVKDLGMMYQQEEFVRIFSHNRGVPDHIEEKFKRLGSDKFIVRDAASKELYDFCQKDRGEIRWLFWGRHNKDPEVSHRCNSLLKKMFLCSTCSGKGTSENWKQWPCLECDGQGHLWNVSPWDELRSIE